jgi:hypothetical protein
LACDLHVLREAEDGLRTAQRPCVASAAAGACPMSRHPRRLRFLLFLGLFATLNLTGSSLPLQSPPPSFQATGLQAGRGYFGQLPFERVDMITGDLNLVFEDLALPGAAGMDLRIVRAYSRNSWNWKWQVGLAGIPIRVGHPTPPHPNEEGLNYPTLYMGDGSSRKMWPVGDPWSSTVFVAGDFSRFDSVTRTLTMPNGWAATYESGNPVGGVMLVEVHDVYGNSITPAWEAHSSGYRPFRMTSVTQLTAGQTRTIAFTYPGFWTYSPATMSYDDGTSTRTWTYGVDGEGRFTSVTPPVGPGWTIDYPTNGLTVTTPAGGWVSYTLAQQLTPEDQWVWVVASRTTGGGRGVAVPPDDRPDAAGDRALAGHDLGRRVYTDHRGPAAVGDVRGGEHEPHAPARDRVLAGGR